MIDIPEEIKGAKLPQLIQFEMNALDPEALLPALFYLVQSKGKPRSKSPKPPSIQELARKVASSGRLEGFDSETGQILLENWLRRSIVVVTRKGESTGSGLEQISYIRPLHFLAFKPCLPQHYSRLRQVDQFLYSLLAKYAPRTVGVGEGAPRALLEEAFSRGVTLTRDMSGTYDGTTDLDTETMLSLYTLEQMDPILYKDAAQKEQVDPACKIHARLMADDINLLLHAYYDRMPSQVLAQYLMSLIQFNLFIYTLKLVNATNSLVQSGELPVEMQHIEDWNDVPPTDLEVYVDLTGRPNSKSEQIARDCYQRDRSELHRFAKSLLMLRTIHRFVSNVKRKAEFPTGKEPDYLLRLVQLRSHPDIQADARKLMGDVQDLNRLDLDAEEEEVAKKRTKKNVARSESGLPVELEMILNMSNLSDIERCVEIVFLGQERTILGNMRSWFHKVAGHNREDGILFGGTRGRAILKYSFGDGLLEALVQLALVSSRDSKGRGLSQLTLTDFLSFLRSRYGILIDRPPSFARTPEAEAAADENFEALKRRLRHMGLFTDLSDARDSQRILQRYNPHSIAP